MGSRTTKRIVLLLFAFAAGACGDESPVALGGGPEDCGDLGTFTAAVSGTVSTSLSGCSFFGVAGAAGEPSTFALYLFQGVAATPAYLLTVTRSGPRPATGAYTIGVDGEQLTATFNVDNAGEHRRFIVSSGAMSVSGTSTPDRLHGNVNFSATEVGGAAPTVTIIGSFKAQCATSPC